MDKMLVIISTVKNNLKVLGETDSISFNRLADIRIYEGTLKLLDELLDELKEEIERMDGGESGHTTSE